MTTLNTYLSSATGHDEFCKAVIDEFENVYASPESGMKMERKVVREDEVKISKVWDGAKELKVRYPLLFDFYSYDKLTRKLELGMAVWTNT